jgi:hypothetical protein
MTDTISISSKPRIKCFVGNNKLCNTLSYVTANVTLEKVRNLTEEEWLWTDESAFCICTHHVEQHRTVRDQYGRVITIYCHSRSGNNENCNCGLFRTRSIKINSHIETLRLGRAI